MADVALQPELPGRGDRAAAREPARPAWCSSARIPAQVASSAMAAALYGDGASVRLHRARHRGVDQGDDARRHAGVLEAELRAEQRRARSCRARSRRPSCGRWSRRRSATGSAARRRSRRSAARRRPRRKLVIVDKPGAPQTQLRVATIGAPRATPDYEAMQVMNEALGGLFSSRINMNLREQHGYTYGASSQFVFRRAAGPFLVASGVRTDVTAPAVTEIFKEVRRMRETPMTPEELALAKDSLVRSLPAQFETSSSVTASTANIYIYDLGPRLLHEASGARLSAVTAEQVKAAAEKYLVPEKLIVVAVGDRAKIARRAAEAEPRARSKREDLTVCPLRGTARPTQMEPEVWSRKLKSKSDVTRPSDFATSRLSRPVPTCSSSRRRRSPRRGRDRRHPAAVRRPPSGSRRRAGPASGRAPAGAGRAESAPAAGARRRAAARARGTSPSRRSRTRPARGPQSAFASRASSSRSTFCASRRNAPSPTSSRTLNHMPGLRCCADDAERPAGARRSRRSSACSADRETRAPARRPAPRDRSIGSARR